MAVNVKPRALHVLFVRPLLVEVVDSAEEPGQVSKLVGADYQGRRGPRGAQQVHNTVVVVKDVVAREINFAHLFGYQRCVRDILGSADHEPLGLVFLNQQRGVVALAGHFFEFLENCEVLYAEFLQVGLEHGVVAWGWAVLVAEAQVVVEFYAFGPQGVYYGSFLLEDLLRVLGGHGQLEEGVPLGFGDLLAVVQAGRGQAHFDAFARGGGRGVFMLA